MNLTLLAVLGVSLLLSLAANTVAGQRIVLRGDAGGPRFDGIGVVNGGGATSVLLKDYPEPQRSQILDLVYKPKFGASVSALLVEIPGDGNSTQGSMPSHMHTRDDLDFTRGYTWWVLTEAKKRNPNLTLDATAWSTPGWVGQGPGKAGRVHGTKGDAAFWSQDAADYYVKWLQGLRDVYGLHLDAIGCRNEKGYSLAFAKLFRKTLNANGFEKVKLHAFDHWPADKFDFVKAMASDPEAQAAIDVLGAHVLSPKAAKGVPASPEIRALAEKMGKPIWNTEEHVYKKGFDCAIGIVQAFNANYIASGATKIVNWYDIAGVYPMEPYSQDPAMLLAHWPWSGHYQVREALWGYAHYGQFTEVGWQYLNGGCLDLPDGGSVVTLKSSGDDFSIILETKDAKAPQELTFDLTGLSAKPLTVWRSNAREQFVQLRSIRPENGSFTITADPDSIYSISTTTGQQKGSFDDIPAPASFPFPYEELFDTYTPAKAYGHLPRYTADIAGAFELAGRPEGGRGMCLRQVVPVRTISWAPDWLPYTILGDEKWTDYDVSAEVYLNPGDTAGVMGRVNHVGTGYGFIPKGYYATLSADGQCQLVVVRGKKDKKQLVGDAEQQAAIKAANDASEGGEKVLATARVPDVKANEWYQLKLRFSGQTLTVLIDGQPVLTATDATYSHGMAGLLAGADGQRLSTPYFDDLCVNAVDGPTVKPAEPLPNQRPLYGQAK